MLEDIQANIAKHTLTKLPIIAKVGIALVPFPIKAKVITDLLNILMKDQMEDEELDFLNGKWVRIDVTDFDLSFEVSFNQKWLIREPKAGDVTFSADSRALIKIAAAKEDPDTLFFQRQLKINGDTELGLEVKNLLLSIELDEMPKTIKASVDKLASLVTALENNNSQIA